VTDVVQAARFDRPFQAELCRMFLESHGIHAVVFDAQSYGYSEGALVGVRVMVLDEDLAEAREVLRSYKP
jgi:Putative prokaryotic signal transducing protein